MCYHWVDTSAGGVLVLQNILRPVVFLSHVLSLGRYLCWLTISPQEYSPSSSVFITCAIYHWVDTSAGGLLVPKNILRPVAFLSHVLSLGRYLCWWTISPEEYSPTSSVFITCSITGSIPLLVDY